ncbi:VOC family protein [Pseudomarimonas arenosa]|uniref:VOC family protein n=1 Tax=Pseudomarimonas arenosa TaxID=2774145 RepID=A0AAW3ZMD9_9GAMM|nr:VOC family protein [Pseudomarimonas arenosa]
MSAAPRFHLAFPVDDLEAARGFYAGVLGCGVGREAHDWIDFDLGGHQIVAHKVSADSFAQLRASNPVDGKQVPAFHFGLVLDWDAFEPMAERLRQAGVAFVIEPYLRFEGRVGEQATMFVRDPSGNCLEFKAFRDISKLFSRDLDAYP